MLLCLAIVLLVPAIVAGDNSDGSCSCNSVLQGFMYGEKQSEALTRKTQNLKREVKTYIKNELETAHAKMRSEYTSAIGDLRTAMETLKTTTSGICFLITVQSNTDKLMYSQFYPLFCDTLVFVIDSALSSNFKQNRSTQGCKKFKVRVQDNIRTYTSPKWDRTRWPVE